MDWIKEKLVAMFAPKYIGAVARWILALTAGGLLKIGVPSEQVDAFIAAADPVLVGALTAGCVLIWSLIQKKKNSD